MVIGEFLDYTNDQNSEQNAFRWFLREALARKASSNIWGQGFSFYSVNERIEQVFKDFDFDNQLLNLFSFAEKYCSMYGRAIFTLQQTKGNKLVIQLVNPFYFSALGKVLVTPQLAVMWQRFNIDQRSYIIKSVYTTKDVTNTVYADGDGYLYIFDEQVKIMDELQIKPYWKHNLGFVPVIEWTNLPYYQQVYNNWLFVSITDWYPAFAWEKTLYIAKKNFEKELTFNHSRLIFENADQRVMENIRKQELADSQVDMIDFWIETETGAEVKVQPSNADFAKYTQAINSILDFYFKFAGISKFSEGGGAQKTVAETSTIRSQLIESINQKINLRTHQINRLISIILKAHNVADYDNFIFKINGNILKDETSYIDNIIKKIQAGLISPVDAIQDLFNINQTEAQKQFERVEEFNKEHDIVLGFNGFNDNEEAGITATGEHPNDLAKQGKD